MSPDVCVVLHLVLSLPISGPLAEVGLRARSELSAIDRLHRRRQRQQEREEGEGGAGHEDHARTARAPEERRHRDTRATTKRNDQAESGGNVDFEPLRALD